MKKLLALLLAMAMIFGLFACASKDTPIAEENNTEAPANEAPAEEENELLSDAAIAPLVEAPNQHLTSAEPIAKKDNLVPDAIELLDYTFDDVEGHWAEPAIRIAIAGGYMKEYENNQFAPEKSITCSDFLLMLELLPNVDQNKLSAYTNLQNDQNLTRLNAAEMIAASVGITVEDVQDWYKATFLLDEAWVSKYAKNLIKENNIDEAVMTKLFNSELSRAETAEILVWVLEKESRAAIYIDPIDGNDSNDGTKYSPVKTISAAQTLLRKYNTDMKNHLFVFLKSGDYYLETPIALSTEDSGSNGYRVVFTSYGKDVAQLSAAKEFSGFELSDSERYIWRTYVGNIQTRQVFINDVRATRARSDGGLANCEIVEGIGFLCDDTYLAEFKNVTDLELVSYTNWLQPRVHLSDIQIEDNRAKLILAEGDNVGRGAATPPQWIENAYELLDLPGEWYIDSSDGYLYYIPREFEDPKTMKATVPVGEQLLSIIGSVDAPVHNITFEGLEFAYTTWLIPEGEAGRLDLQNNRLPDDQIAPASVYVEYGRYIDFTDNKFYGLGQSGLQMYYAIQECDIIGNEFSNIAGGAFNLGNGSGADYTTEVKPTEYKYYTINNRFNNNFIHDVALDYGSAAAVSTSFPKFTQFNHNEISGCQYTGFSSSWGWAEYGETTETPGTGLYGVEMNYNFVQDVANTYVYDAGAFYCCGGSGATYDNPNYWSNNYVKNQRNAYAPFYLDEGSTFWYVSDNVIEYDGVDTWHKDGRLEAMEPANLMLNTDNTRYNTIRNNYSTTGKNATMYTGFNNIEDVIVVEDGNWNTEAQSIVDESGLEKEFLANYPAPVQGFNINLYEFIDNIGATAQIELEVYGRKDYVPSQNEYQIYYLSGNSSVAQVDSNGLITLVGRGVTKIYANVFDGEIVRTKEISIISGDVAKRVNLERIDLVEGFYNEYQPTVTTEFEQTLAVDSVTYEFADKTIAAVNDDGTIQGLAEGSTTAHVVFTAAGLTLEKDLPVTVYNYAEDHNYSANPLPDGVYNPSNWTENTRAATTENDGIQVTGYPGYYVAETLGDGLYTFKFSLTEGGMNWPSLILRSNNNDATKQVWQNDVCCYLIGFADYGLEIQRFNNGARTYLLGNGDFEKMLGVGIPNTNGQLLAREETYTITVGTITEENGVRIILDINGKNYVNILDTFDGYLADPGYFGVEIGSSVATLTPVA